MGSLIPADLTLTGDATGTGGTVDDAWVGSFGSSASSPKAEREPLAQAAGPSESTDDERAPRGEGRPARLGVRRRVCGPRRQIAAFRVTRRSRGAG
jgi:hypothetical protein